MPVASHTAVFQVRSMMVIMIVESRGRWTVGVDTQDVYYLLVTQIAVADMSFTFSNVSAVSCCG